MNKNNNILQRARNFDLTESELEALYSDSDQLNQMYDEALVEKIAEELFVPGSADLLEQKRKGIERLTKSAQIDQQKTSIFSLKIIGIAASLVILVGAFILLRPQSGELSEKQLAEFKEISRSTYSPEVIASLERSNAQNENLALVSAYTNKNYAFILSHTKGELDNAEMQLLRARVLMDLKRYAEGYALMKSITEEDLVQKDVYLWMMAEGALGVGDVEKFHNNKNQIIKNSLPNFQKLK